MAELARIPRPWLPLLRRPIQTCMVASPYVGLGQSRSFSATAAVYRTQMKTAHKSMRRNEVNAQPQFLLPFTIVPPPIWRWPTSPSKFFQMAYLVAKNRFQALFSLIGIYFVSFPEKSFGLPRFRAHKGATIPTAKALHLEMSEAVASGDKETLRRVCSGGFFGTLAGVIDNRPHGVRAEWELLRYVDKARYPRLADFRCSYQPSPSGKAKDMRLVKQAVVSISSVQRIARYYDRYGGAKIPGSEREQHLVEHIVLQAEIKDKTFESEPWKIWGTLSEMSFEKMRDDAALFTELMAQNAKAGR
ncbi:hypothetical protein F5B22DRAFT_39924 [Xylaria bambusicola]|uniref:uncharacterized protein n=1 Tax=Xylaria bambusicola TaxID=326684 RepID=UPI0020081A4A|nr:uncharacterized protein F5B22DRAFT_39924 [Xylaria bambusicola]KAI0521142.1 hypothetical protein F5B22DRAFT_39924 [Xylaria bambusicola]